MLAVKPDSGKRDGYPAAPIRAFARHQPQRRQKTCRRERQTGKNLIGGFGRSPKPDPPLSWPESGQPRRPSCDACDASSWQPGKPRQQAQRPQAQPWLAQQPQEPAQRPGAAPQAQERQPEEPARRLESQTRLRKPPQSVVTRSVSYFSRSPFAMGLAETAARV
jgi:hypothetical protein